MKPIKYRSCLSNEMQIGGNACHVTANMHTFFCMLLVDYLNNLLQICYVLVQTFVHLYQWYCLVFHSLSFLQFIYLSILLLRVLWFTFYSAIQLLLCGYCLCFICYNDYIVKAYVIQVPQWIDSTLDECCTNILKCTVTYAFQLQAYSLTY